MNAAKTIFKNKVQCHWQFLKEVVTLNEEDLPFLNTFCLLYSQLKIDYIYCRFPLRWMILIWILIKTNESLVKKHWSFFLKKSKLISFSLKFLSNSDVDPNESSIHSWIRITNILENLNIFYYVEIFLFFNWHWLIG